MPETEPCPICGFEHEVEALYGFPLMVCPGVAGIVVVSEALWKRLLETRDA